MRLFSAISLFSLLSLFCTACGDDGPGDNNNQPPVPVITYHLQIDADHWGEPPGVGNIIGTYVPDFLLSLRASDATRMLVGAATESATGVIQDLCRVTVALDVAGSAPGEAVDAGPADYPLEVTGYDVTLHDLEIGGVLSPTGDALSEVTFTGVLDAREFEAFFGTDATGVCGLVASVGASCEVCDDGAPYCLTLRAAGMSAPQVEDLRLRTVEVISPTCDDLPDCPLTDELRVYRAGAENGYTLFAPLNDSQTYLVDLCGEVVQTWPGTYPPGLAVHLLDNGHVLRAGRVGNTHFNPTSSGGIIEQIAPDGTVVWSYTYSDAQRCTHHDIEPLPGGNVLIVSWEKKTAAEAVAAGRDPSLLAVNELWPDHIIEVEPTPPEGGTIVWEWHAWDHLVQDFDPAQANFGVVADHPELLDIHGAKDATGVATAGADLHHINGIDYHPGLDQILLSMHSTHEIVVIDHSTSTAEAATHVGGRYGMGGDILYRWGNPATYQAAPFDDRFFSAQHDPQWIDPGLPGAGNILVFNNGVNRQYSSVDELVPPVDASGFYLLTPGEPYGPAELLWSYVAPTPQDFFSASVSGAQRLPGGNTLITNGLAGEIFEVDSDGLEVWRLHRVGEWYFRATRYPLDHPGIVALGL